MDQPREKYGAPIEPELHWLIDNFPGYWNWARYMAIAALFQTHRFLIPDEEWKAQGGKFNPLNDKLRDDLTAYIKAQTGGRQDLIDKLIPDYAPFSRRPVVDNGWYKALTRDNVELVTDSISRLTPKGVETEDGTLYDVDVIVTATGFEVIQYLWPTEYTGKGGVNIHDFWSKDGPRAYLGMMTPNFPNMFMIYGPNSQPVSGGTGLPIWYVIWSAYSAQCMVRMIEEGRSRVEVKAEAYERYNEALDAEAVQAHPPAGRRGPGQELLRQRVRPAPGERALVRPRIPPHVHARSTGTTSRSPELEARRRPRREPRGHRRLNRASAGRSGGQMSW